MDEIRLNLSPAEGHCKSTNTIDIIDNLEYFLLEE
jgi:hypothetical protein